MNKSKLVAYVLAAWLAIEIIAFVFVVQVLGVIAAVMLGVGTTLLGLADVKRLFVYLRQRLAQPQAETGRGANLLEGGIEAFGSLLLILPGFASDLVGLALKAPSVRARLADRLRGKVEATKGPRTIDLSPNEWKAVTEEKPRKRRAPARRAPPAGAA
ncbi:MULTISPECIES: FxsA family protein [Methylosinus]|uniref:Exlusion protein FxsA n=1 Tax=Methylosinus trichosporium (strain ATCC 35070 / NCIMB 11131 / UNIQEM 75 / OB3b) TaxID=595536 RepID=A0A2D2D135_METT3|nr:MULTISPECIES: FxsA family protein [Methylosinus]ATQ68664.1 exlusion protein FxsA [Methylosinus trichosporium OB3b]OBS53172.1 exlusion protein FxsA [Methylosinus sp. 3S-1]